MKQPEKGGAYYEAGCRCSLSWQDLCWQSSLRYLWRKTAGKTRPTDEFL